MLTFGRLRLGVRWKAPFARRCSANAKPQATNPTFILHIRGVIDCLTAEEALHILQGDGAGQLVPERDHGVGAYRTVGADLIALETHGHGGTRILMILPTDIG
jgi:hypothetical protein